MSLYLDMEKRLGSFHLRVKLEAADKTTALLGASGCGKSMTLKCIAGIERPDRGRIVLDDTVLFDSERHIDLPPQKRRRKAHASAWRSVQSGSCRCKKPRPQL